MTKKELLIVGGGIAGHSLAHLARKRGVDFSMYDQPQENRSSRIAAGLFNPIVLKRTNLAWKAHETLDFAVPFYKEIEQHCNASFFYQKPLIRIYADHEEANNWEVKSSQPNYERFLNPSPQLQVPIEIDAPFGVGEVREAGYMDMTSFFNSSDQMLQDINVLTIERFEYNDLKNNASGWHYRGEEFQHVVFCEGVGVLNNPYFNHVPVQPNKGELLTISDESSTVGTAYIYSKSMFLIPLGNGRFRAGSTYQRKFDHLEPDPKKKEEILNKMSQLYKRKIDVVGHDWGLRPTVNDRRPLMGAHDTLDGLYIFNGLGSRGVLMAPYLANQLLELIFNHKPLLEELDVKRYH